jgi:hypothetical protein
LSEVLNWDLGSKPYDEPLTDDELAGLSWHGFRDRVIMLSGKKNPSVRDFVEVSGRGTVHEHHAFVGTPKQVADQMEEWFHGGACDGFVMLRHISPALMRISCVLSCRNCSAEASSRRNIPAARCAILWA